MMPHPPDHMVFVILAVLFPLRAATFGFRRLAAADPADVPRVRLWLYRQIIVLQTSLSALVLWIWVAFRRPWVALGLEPLQHRPNPLVEHAPPPRGPSMTERGR